MDLAVFNKDGQPVVSSRKVSDDFGKLHHHVVDAIENKMINLTHENSEVKLQDLFIKSSFEHRGNVYTEYLLTRDGFSFIVMSFTGARADRWKLKYIEAFNKMEQMLREENRPQQIDSKFLFQIAQQLEEKERLLIEQKPKVLFADAVATSKTSILVGELAKILKQNGIEGMGQNRLFAWLRENGFLIKRKGTDYNMPTQKSMELELFEIKETTITHSDGHISVNKTSKVTGKGQIYFINKFKAAEIA